MRHTVASKNKNGYVDFVWCQINALMNKAKKTEQSEKLYEL